MTLTFSRTLRTTCAVATLGVFSIPATATACSHLEHITLAWPYADSVDVPTDSQLWTTASGGPPRLELVDQTDGAIVALDVTATYRGQDTSTPATHTFTPRALLKPNTTYHVRLADPGVQREDAPVAWTFTTASQPYDSASVLGFDRSGAHVDRRMVDETTWDTCGCAHDTLYTLTFDHVPADHPVLYTLRADAPEACSQALHTVHVPTSGTMQATLKHMSTSASPEPCLNVTARDPFRARRRDGRDLHTRRRRRLRARSRLRRPVNA